MPAASARSATPPGQASLPSAPARSRLEQVQRGRQKTARRIMVYGDGGLGKTTLAAGAPKPLFLDVNQGSFGFDVDRYVFDDGRTKPETFEELLAAVNDVASNAGSRYETLVLDVLSDVEQLIWAHMVAATKGKAANIEEIGGGYQKGYVLAVDEWRRLLAPLERAWRAGMHIVLIDHFEVKKEKNAGGADYGRFMPKIHGFASKFLHTWCDYVFFLEVQAILVPDNADARKAKKSYAQSDGQRLLHARPAAEWMAKSRPELFDPLELPETGAWQVLEAEIAASQQRRVEHLRASIEARLPELAAADVESARAAMERAGDDDAKLEKLDNWCAAKCGQKGA